MDTTPLSALTNGAARPKARDLSHHFNATTKARRISPLKDMIGLLSVEGMINLGGGMPHPSIFTFTGLNFDAMSSAVDLDPEKPDLEVSTDTYRVTRFPDPEGGVGLDSLAKTLQYDDAKGLRSLRDFAMNLTETVLKPAYSDCEVVITSGNTDGWAKVCSLFLSPGDHILVEEYTYASAQFTWAPMGCIGVPIKMDEQGLRADHLAEVLENWEVERPGVKKPSLMYIVPVGQNPTGTTMYTERRQAIYDLAVKHDFVICEDDPYFFLQFPEYTVGAEMKKETTAEFVDSLAPSFVKLDVEGRVIRLDTFSKTLAPGCRVGYMILNANFAERILRVTEAHTQTASGFSQVIVSRLMQEWKLNGYLQWCRTLRDQYLIRRSWICDAFAETFDLVPASSLPSLKNALGMVAFAKGSAKSPHAQPLFCFVPPRGGMFVWTKYFLTGNARFEALKKDSAVKDPEAVYAKELWSKMVEEKVLLTTEQFYVPWQGEGKNTTATSGREGGVTYFRLAFSYAPKAALETAVHRIGAVTLASWGL